MRPWLTADIVAHFKAGLSVHELADRACLPVLTVENVIRRWLIVYPDGKPAKRKP